MTRELLISDDRLGARAVTLDDGHVIGYDAERKASAIGEPGPSPVRVGSIWRMRVESVSDNMHAAFLDMGLPSSSQAFLPAGELVASCRKVKGRPNVSGVVAPGQSVVVQVVREAQGAKGARVTMSPTLSGMYANLTPFDDRLAGLARSVAASERPRLKALVPRLCELAGECIAEALANKRLVPPQGLSCGIVLRQSAANAADEAVSADVAALARRWARVWERARADGGPALIEGADGLVRRSVLAAVKGGVAGIATDSAGVLSEVKELMEAVPEEWRPALSLEPCDAGVDLFRAHGAPDVEEGLLRRKVALPSGTWICIDAAEALTVIDVNAGHGAAQRGGGERGASQALGVDIDAASGIARQIAARSITGCIVIDFITIRNRSQRERVTGALKSALAGVGVQAQVSGMSDAGLVEVIVKGGPMSMSSRMTQPCSCCGCGRELADEALVGMFERKACRVLATHPDAREVRVGVSPRLARLLALDGCDVCDAVERAGHARMGIVELTPAQREVVLSRVADPLFADLAFEVLSWAGA